MVFAIVVDTTENGPSKLGLTGVRGIMQNIEGVEDVVFSKDEPQSSNGRHPKSNLEFRVENVPFTKINRMNEVSMEYAYVCIRILEVWKT